MGSGHSDKETFEWRLECSEGEYIELSRQGLSGAAGIACKV